MIGQLRALSPRLGGSAIWLEAVGEILIVTLGVLLAFGLNAWWVESTKQAEETTHLRALASDFERNVSLYDELIERAALGSSASLELLQLARKQPDADPRVVWRLMNDVFQSFRAEPALDAYQALVNSAGLALIRDEELRSDLAGFADRATDPYQERFADEFYMKFLTTYVGRLQIAGPVAQDGTQAQSFAEVLTDSAFQEHLAFRYVLERDVAGTYCELWREAATILEELRLRIEPRMAVLDAGPSEPAYCARPTTPAADPKATESSPSN